MLDIPIDASLGEQLKKSADTNDLKKCIKFEQDHEDNVIIFLFLFFLKKFFQIWTKGLGGITGQR